MEKVRFNSIANVIGNYIQPSSDKEDNPNDKCERFLDALAIIVSKYGNELLNESEDAA